jgi:hypothetical protein
VARAPFQISALGSFGETADHSETFHTLPGGVGVAVIEQVTFQGFLREATEIFWDLRIVTRFRGKAAVHIIKFERVGSELQWRATENVRFYADPGSTLTFAAQRIRRGFTTPAWSGTICGYVGDA